MNDFSRVEVFNSYLFLRKILGITNPVKNEPFNIGISYEGDRIFAINEVSKRRILLLQRSSKNQVWSYGGVYPELEPICSHIKRAIQGRIELLISECAFDALKNVVRYDV